MNCHYENLCVFMALKYLCCFNSNDNKRMMMMMINF